MQNLDLLIPTAPEPKNDWYTWGTVTQASPLRVKLDGETAALAITPDTLVRNLAVNDRVWVQVTGRRLVVKGRSGGQTVDTSVSTSLVPTGAVMTFAGATAPANYLICDGSAVSRTTYAALFAVIGTTYGVGDNSTTFNLPDLRVRSPLGVGTDAGGDAGTSITLGQRGGNYKILTAELPAHTHGVGTLATSSAGSHDHALNLGSGTGASSINIARSVSTTDTAARGPVSNDGAHTHTLTGSTASTGSGTPHLPAFVGLNYIIKT